MRWLIGTVSAGVLLLCSITVQASTVLLFEPNYYEGPSGGTEMRQVSLRAKKDVTATEIMAIVDPNQGGGQWRWTIHKGLQWSPEKQLQPGQLVYEKTTNLGLDRGMDFYTTPCDFTFISGNTYLISFELLDSGRTMQSYDETRFDTPGGEFRVLDAWAQWKRNWLLPSIGLRYAPKTSESYRVDPITGRLPAHTIVPAPSSLTCMGGLFAIGLIASWWRRRVDGGVTARH